VIPISPLTSCFVSLALALFAWIVASWSIRKLDQLEHERMNMQRGTAGETLVAITLAQFPEEFRIINDLTTPYGNLDHVVVGPTGVFVLDTKNWRGVVSADGHGELLSNGKSTEKRYVWQFLGRIMGIKDRVKALAPDLVPFFQAVFVFTAARVEANWGSTKNVHCIGDDQLFEYIVQRKKGKRLTEKDVGTIAQAFLGLAQMDADFTVKMHSKGESQKAESTAGVSAPSHAKVVASKRRSASA